MKENNSRKTKNAVRKKKAEFSKFKQSLLL